MVASGKSSTGFGHGPFGHGPFGHGKWASKVLFERFPTWVREADLRVGGEVSEPLRRYNKVIEDRFEEVRIAISNFTSLTDADRTPEKNLASHAYNYGIPQSAEEKDIAFRRSEILNQHLLILRKGFRKGYQIIGSFFGLTVTVDHLWAIDCCDSNTAFVKEPPNSYMGNFDAIKADVIPLDKFYENRFDQWPLPLCPFGLRTNQLFDQVPADVIPLDSDEFLRLQCPTHFIDLEFTSFDDTEIDYFTAISRGVIRELERMRPIHVEFRNIVFDGPKASAYWTTNIEADADASAYWTATIAGLDAASAYWTANIDTSLVA